jgi:GNAT superfamily N-acetyltransferase
MDVRSAEERELDELARLWYDAWHDSHARIVPVERARLRTLENLKQRLEAAFSDLRVVGPVGAPVGLCVLKGDELYQLFVSAQSRGTGVAAALIADAEARLSASRPPG